MESELRAIHTSLCMYVYLLGIVCCWHLHHLAEPQGGSDTDLHAGEQQQ